MTHVYKVWPRFFDDLESGAKPFDVRKVDPRRKAVQVGDLLHYQEWDPDSRAVLEHHKYTGREGLKRVTYVLMGDGAVLPFGWFVMGLEPVP